MKRTIVWTSMIALAALMAACGGTLELGVEPEASATEEASAPLQAEVTGVPTGEPVEEEMIEEIPDLDAAFSSEIIGALNGHNDAALVDAMGDSFVIGFWRSEGITVPPEEAPQQIYNYLPEGALIQHYTDPANFPALDGMDASQMFGPDVAVEDILYTVGWGEDGHGEALLYVARDASGDLYWHGMVIALAGFDDLSAAPPSAGFPVVDALNARDESGLAAQMADPFAFGFWRTEWQSLTPDEALVPIMDQLPDGARLDSTTDQAAFPDLDGQPVETMLGPDVPLEQVVFVTGWGPEGQGEALLFMARSEGGAPVWQAMLFAREGFD